LSIQIDPRTVADLKWFHDAEFAGDMGFKSPQGRIEDALVAGGFVQSSHVNHGISLQAMNAATRLKAIQTKITRLNETQRAILSLAFRTSRQHGDSLYGTYPRVALATTAARKYYIQDQPGQDLKHLEVWLNLLAYNSRSAKKLKSRMDAAQQVGYIRTEAEEILAAAISAYGSKTTVKTAPNTFSVKELSRRLHSDPRTIRRELSRHGITVEVSNGRKGAAIPVAALKEHWGEIMDRLA